MKLHYEKVLKLDKADIHIHYNNNISTATVTVVKSGLERKGYSREYLKENIIERWYESTWNGNLNIRNEFLEPYGDILEEKK